MTLLLDLTLRSSALLLLGLALRALLLRHSAAWRHAVLAASLVAAALVGPLGRLAPSWRVDFSAAHAATPTPDDGLVASADGDIVAASTRGVRRATVERTAVGIWATVAALNLGFLLIGLAHLAWLSRRSTPVRDGMLHRVAEELSLAIGREPVTLLQTGRVNVLATWGARRPRVLLPSHAATWSEHRARIVLAHELAHIQRRDWLLQIGAETLRAVFWFNPLLWIACRQLRRDGEQACDDHVLAAGVPGDRYAVHLLALARRTRRLPPSLASAMPMARPSTLERRITAMLNPDLNRTAPSARALALTGLLMIAAAVPVAVLQAQQTTPLPLAGAVYDPTGAVLPGVELTLEDEQQRGATATSDGAGKFEFPSVAPGRYVLKAKTMGFRSLTQELELSVARDWDRAVMLQVGSVQETVNVRTTRVAKTGAAPSSAAPKALRVGGNIKPPTKITNVNATFPPSMREAGLSGVVPLEATIGADGAVTSVRVLSAQVHPDFANAAIEAVRQWRYTPTLLNGVPVEITMTVTVAFSLQN
jgi:TonB family protein